MKLVKFNEKKGHSSSVFINIYIDMALFSLIDCETPGNVVG